jgi:predicted PurR-regulated permease PerM
LSDIRAISSTADAAPSRTATISAKSTARGASVTDQPPRSTAAEADASRFPRVAMPSRAAVVAAAGLVAALFLAYLVGEVLAIFVIGLIFAYLLDVPVSWLARHGVPRGIGAILSIAALAIVVLLFIVIVFGAILEQGAAFIAGIPAAIQQIEDWYATTQLPAEVRAVLDSFFKGITDWASSFNMAAFVAEIVAAIFGLLGSFFSLMVLPFFLFFVLKDRPRLSNAAWGTFPAAWRGDARKIGTSVIENFGNYVRAESILMVLLGLITWAGLMLLSVVVDPRFAEFALFLALIAAVCELIPTFGPILALIPALLFSLTLGPGPMVATLILYLCIMFIEGQVLVPTIEGKQFEIHPAWVLVLILVGLALVGPLGAILALPVAAAARDVYAYIFRRAAGLEPSPTLATEPTAAPEESKGQRDHTAPPAPAEGGTA